MLFLSHEETFTHILCHTLSPCLQIVVRQAIHHSYSFCRLMFVIPSIPSPMCSHTCSCHASCITSVYSMRFKSITHSWDSVNAIIPCGPTCTQVFIPCFFLTTFCYILESQRWCLQSETGLKSLLSWGMCAIETAGTECWQGIISTWAGNAVLRIMPLYTHFNADWMYKFI